MGVIWFVDECSIAMIYSYTIQYMQLQHLTNNGMYNTYLLHDQLTLIY